MLEAIMKENIALLLAILYLIYRYKTYKKVNKTIEDRIKNVHKPYFKRVRDVLGCSEEEAEKVGCNIPKGTNRREKPRKCRKSSKKRIVGL